MGLFSSLFKSTRKSSSSRDKADRRAGPRQGPYVSGGKLPRARNNNGRWRSRRSECWSSS